jgi:hypothetical protein
MKRAPRSKIPKHPAMIQELHLRLAELETEVRTYPARSAQERALKAITQPEEGMVGQEKIIQFQLHKKTYAAGHSDMTYSGSNHARGVRHIRLYAEGKLVFDIEGDFEDQQFGSNFRFQNVDAYVPGEWEAELVKLTDDLRHFIAKRRSAFKKKRDAEHAKR